MFGRERDRQTDRQTDRDTERQRERQRETETERQRQADTQTDTHRDRDTERTNQQKTEPARDCLPQGHHGSPVLVPVQCCFTSTETIMTVRDGEPRTSTSSHSP